HILRSRTQCERSRKQFSFQACVPPLLIEVFSDGDCCLVAMYSAQKSGHPGGSVSLSFAADPVCLSSDRPGLRVASSIDCPALASRSSRLSSGRLITGSSSGPSRDSLFLPVIFPPGQQQSAMVRARVSARHQNVARETAVIAGRPKFDTRVFVGVFDRQRCTGQGAREILKIATIEADRCLCGCARGKGRDLFAAFAATGVNALQFITVGREAEFDQPEIVVTAINAKD